MSREELIESLLTDMQVFQRAWKAHIMKVLEKEHISPAQTGILFYIKNSQPVSGKKIATMMQMSPSSVTQFIDSLDKKGYIKREQDEQDRRITHLSISTKGQSKIQQLEKVREVFFRELAQSLTDDELTTMSRVQRKLAQQIEN